jgi:RimJ/RimL family protein N-acetyltransferase
MTGMGAPQPPVLNTARLTLRRWRDSDFAPFRIMNADPEVMRYFARPQTADESDATASRIMQFFDAGLGPWAVEVPGEAAFIGFVGCWHVRPHLPFAPAIEIGWRLSRTFWGRGYATETAIAALGDAFDRVEPMEIVAYTAVLNEPSMAVMRRLGMGHDRAADFDNPAVPEGHPNRPHALFRLSRAAFRARQAA